MKKIFFLFFFLLTALTKAQNPYAALGIEEQVLNYDSQHKEIFDNDTLKAIGYALYNPVSGLVAIYDLSDSLVAVQKIDPSKVARWLSVDPKAADAPDWSPYRAFFCNPIRYIDPDGQWEWDATGNLVAQKGDNSYSMAKFLGTSQSNAMQMLNRSGITTNEKGILNLKEGQSLLKYNLFADVKSTNGIVVNNSKEATAHYYYGNGEAADVGDQSTSQLLVSDKFQAKHTKITSEQVKSTGDFNVDLTNSTFHIGRTNVDYNVTNNGSSSAVNYTLFSKDGFWDPNFVAEKSLGKYFDRYKPDQKGPNLETPGGTPYDYKTRDVVRHEVIARKRQEVVYLCDFKMTLLMYFYGSIN